MAPPRFGTDGVRGAADGELSEAFVGVLGRAAVAHLGPGPYLIARDTRISGPALEAALAAGIVAEGGAVELLGVLPTPGLAGCAARDGRPAAMISASHNPFTDNGVKLFAAGGRKLDDATQAAIQADIDRLWGEGTAVRLPAVPAAVRDRSDEYVAGVVASLDGRRLDGLRVVVDCANGAASGVARTALEALGATVVAIHDTPDGVNINEGCGSTHPADLQARVVAEGADAGLAFDGDADRVIAVDEQGGLVDGDRIIAICALDRQRRGALPGNTVVVTVMTNLGFRLAMAEHGIAVVETAVGDRYVLEALEANGWSLGGEQSGHVIHRDLATTGDGLLTGVQLLDALVRSGRPLRALADAGMRQFPQVLRNVRVAGDRDRVVDGMRARVAELEQELGERGRVVLRPSGTEPLIRVMAEAETPELAAKVVEELCDLAEALGRS
jgi:phosphoglucosamine mutase